MKGQIELSRLDAGNVEQVVDQADDMLAGGADVAQVFAVALVLDRSEALLDHHFGEADDGVQRRAYFVADARQEIRFLVRRGLGGAARGEQLGLGALPVRDVAQHGAEATALVAGDAAHGHEERDRADAGARLHLAAFVQEARDAAVLQAGEIVARRLSALFA